MKALTRVAFVWRATAASAHLLVALTTACASDAKAPPDLPASGNTEARDTSARTKVAASDPTRDAPPRDDARAPNARRGPRGDAPAPEPELLELAVSGFENAVVVVPSDTRPVPLLVATHGAGGDPTWECERWARVARERWFLLCPSGLPLRRGEAGSYYYPDHHALEREVVASIAAARARFAGRITPDGGVYVGYSQGATMGALMVVEHGRQFPHLLLIEGGSGDWTLGRARSFRATGGESVFIVCGTNECERRATRSRPVLERAGLRAETRAVSGGGHTELGEVGVEAEKLLETLAPR